MKILLVGPDYPDTPIRSLYNLLKIEHQVQVFDPFKYIGPIIGLGNQLNMITAAWQYLLKATIREPFKVSNQYLVKFCKDFKPDLVFIISIDLILPEVIEKIKSDLNTTVIGWYMDHIANFGRCYFMAAHYDVLFFKDTFIVNLLRRKFCSSKIYYLPQCCDPALHKPVTLTDKEKSIYGCDLTIAGNLYYYRVQMLEQFSEYNIKIWGSRQSWIKTVLNKKHMGCAVYGLEKSKAMLASKIVLNNCHYAEIDGVNKRTFEVAGCGAFQLADSPGISEFFKEGSEIITFTTKDDLKEKVDYFLSHEKERKTIAALAQKRAYEEHTYAHRWKKILEVLYNSQ